MPKPPNYLNQKFRPQSYQLLMGSNNSRLIITGKKMPPPSKRITLHQKGLKIAAAKITRNDKKGPTEHEVLRINHMPTFEEVRIHTKGLLYPGQYVIELEFQLEAGKLEVISKLGDKKPGRDLLPSIDEPEAWDGAAFEIKQ